ncbi:MAG: hypothetical protein O7F14_06990 [Alphaproteobacteria bacterium]|nr:hypothetical protein [Alphaproteobacteria bacterium]
MEKATGIINLEGLYKRSCLMFISIGGITVLFSLVLSLSFTFASSAVATRGGGYLTFAEVSNKERTLNEDDCRKYGGRPVTSGEYDVVLKSGRSDDELYNVIYFSGSQYVTFKIEESNSISRFFGIQSQKIGLCQF